MSWLLPTALLVFATSFAHGSGVFQLSLLTYHNEHGHDARGLCCEGERSVDGSCSGDCATFFRVCLKQFQHEIDPNPPCIYGSLITKVLGGNRVDFAASADAPFPFPYTHAWPGTFTLIVEAWHNGTAATTTTHSSADGGDKQLLMRIAEQKSLRVSPEWTVETHGTNSSRLELKYRSVCDELYYGAHCTDYCRPMDSQHGHYGCSADDGRRLCLAGWEGPLCDKAICATGCHPEHGSCESPGECRCRPGWIGDRCDQCQKYSHCQHGTCDEPYQCTCDEGWGGLLCNQDLNYCTHHKPCVNGAICTNTGAGYYTCTCQPGFTGVNCQTKIEDCSASPCLNGGSCTAYAANYSCSCLDGFSGRHCQISAQSCVEKPCENGGTCVDQPLGGYFCLCPLGWAGSNCDVERDECQSEPCANGGRCLDLFNGFQCVCPVGFDGRMCEQNINDCSQEACLNGGTCVDEVNSFKCHCPAGWTGTLCQENYDDCVTRPCANGGTCFDMLNGFRCVCRPGFGGDDCRVDVNECSSMPCRNGGSCEDTIDDYHCRCPACFSGKNCDLRDDDCRYEATFGPRGVTPAGVGLAARERQTTADLSLIIGLPTLFLLLVFVAILSTLVCYLYRQRTKHRGDVDVEARENAANQRRLATQTSNADFLNNKFISFKPAAFGDLSARKVDNAERCAALKKEQLEKNLGAPPPSPGDANLLTYKAVAVEKLADRPPSLLRKGCAERPCVSPGLQSDVSKDSGLGSPSWPAERRSLSSLECESVLDDDSAAPARTRSRQSHRHPPPPPVCFTTDV